MPGRVGNKDGKKQPHFKWWNLDSCFGLAAVFWNGDGGPKAFHSRHPNTSLKAVWKCTTGDVRGDQGMLCMDACEDPYWQSNTKLQNDSVRKTADGQVLERLVDQTAHAKSRRGSRCAILRKPTTR